MVHRLLSSIGVRLFVVSALCSAACVGAPDADPAPLASPETAETPTTVDESCRPDVVGEESGLVLVIFPVIRGQRADACFEMQPRMSDGPSDTSRIAEEGWDALAEVVPPEQLDAIELFAAFRSIDDTLAFAGPIGAGNDGFVIAIDLETAAADRQELSLTMLHELAHVFTQTPDQLDLNTGYTACETYWNGFGCFRPGSYLAEWIDEFWSDDQLLSLPAGGAGDESGGVRRCSLDPGFLGAYAASHPEEDFAESFSAFVFDVDVPPELAPRMAFFEARPELVAFADRAAAADRDGLRNNFDRCG